MRELVQRVAERLRCSPAQARLCVDAVVEAIGERCAVRLAGVFRRDGAELVFEVRDGAVKKRAG